VAGGNVKETKKAKGSFGKFEEDLAPNEAVSLLRMTILDRLASSYKVL
jgi:hypothetical protein